MFGERLQQLRSQRDMKQAVLAKRLGVSRSAINAWENGISFPSLANLFELCHVFGTTPDYLLGFSAEHCVAYQRPHTQPTGNGGAADSSF